MSTRFLVLYWFPRDDDGEPRLGLAVPKGTGTAVERNRVKRRLRERWRDASRAGPARPRLRPHRAAGLGEAPDGHDAAGSASALDEVLGKAAA